MKLTPASSRPKPLTGDMPEVFRRSSTKHPAYLFVSLNVKEQTRQKQTQPPKEAQPALPRDYHQQPPQPQSFLSASDGLLTGWAGESQGLISAKRHFFDHGDKQKKRRPAGRPFCFCVEGPSRTVTTARHSDQSQTGRQHRQCRGQRNDRRLIDNLCPQLFLGVPVMIALGVIEV